MGLIHTPEVHQLCSGVVPAAASVLATEGFSQSWWIYVVVFLAVAAAWAGVPVIGGVAAATAGALASQGKLELAAVVAMVAVAGEVGGLIGYRIGFRWGRSLVERPGKRQESREKALATAEHIYAKWGRLAVGTTDLADRGPPLREAPRVSVELSTHPLTKEASRCTVTPD